MSNVSTTMPASVLTAALPLDSPNRPSSPIAMPPASPTALAPGNGGTGPTGFSDRITEALESVNAQQQRATQATRDFEAGRTDDLVGVMVEQQLSSLSFEMTKQIRNRAITAYRDIMNMPI